MPASPFKLKSPYQPAGDQPKAIKQLLTGLNKKQTRQTLLGVTGSGKTFTMANVIAKSGRPALVISHNKTLTAQLTEEFQEFFPDNAVHYFVSYYDYYQPEAYVPRSDTYIAKDASINDEIDRLRHAALEAVLTRDDVIVVASVSCIYGLGQPADYLNARLELKVGESLSRTEIIRHLTRLQYSRNDFDLTRGHFRLRGDTLDIHPAGEDHLLRIALFGPHIEKLSLHDSLTGHLLSEPKEASIFPATFFATDSRQNAGVIAAIRDELRAQLQTFKQQNKLVEAQRLEERVNYDLEMLEQVGYVSGIENYSRYFDGRAVGQPPATLLDYFRFRFGKNFLTFIDESHMTIPQISAMQAGDRARKQVLIDYGFRLKSAFDNRPLKFSEFEDKVSSTIFVSATPSPYERNTSQQIVEQIVRPTGLLDPQITLHPLEHQIDDVIDNIHLNVKKQQRVLVTTLTKKMAEELATYLIETGTKAAYLHSDVDTLDRLEILKNLRRGTYDVLVGINLLREGLDLPEVSLVCIMDADKEGYLRSATALLQIMGRAARHLDGRVIMYADRVTGSMQAALDESRRRRVLQEKYNQQHHLTPTSISKNLREGAFYKSSASSNLEDIKPETISATDRPIVVKQLTDKMHLAAQNLEFEKAAALRDLINQLQD
jgi:excinuclease ABC subunit B